eukprot:766010-Hanusia_phi.AAC.1
MNQAVLSITLILCKLLVPVSSSYVRCIEPSKDEMPGEFNIKKFTKSSPWMTCTDLDNRRTPSGRFLTDDELMRKGWPGGIDPDEYNDDGDKELGFWSTDLRQLEKLYGKAFVNSEYFEDEHFKASRCKSAQAEGIAPPSGAYMFDDHYDEDQDVLVLSAGRMRDTITGGLPVRRRNAKEAAEVILNFYLPITLLFSLPFLSFVLASLLVLPAQTVFQGRAMVNQAEGDGGDFCAGKHITDDLRCSNSLNLIPDTWDRTSLMVSRGHGVMLRTVG